MTPSVTNEKGGPTQATTVLVVDDEPSLRKALEKTLKGAGYEVSTAEDAEQAMAVLPEVDPQVVVTDLIMPNKDGIELLKQIKETMPATEVLLITGHASIERAVEAMRLGAFDFVEKPIDRSRLLRLVDKAIERQSLVAENVLLRGRLAEQESATRMVGMSPSIMEMRKVAAQISASDVPVLITGESGTGKEVVADLVHSLSTRSKGPMIKISCAAIPEDLLESELFGYERGAFSGAVKSKPGRIELADRGTLFLDEIGDMMPSMQAKLLRVLQDGFLQRLGGTRDIRTDVRIISATNLDIGLAIHDKRFREDLYHRLNVIEIRIPPLRERLEDLPLLVTHFLKRHSGSGASRIEGVTPDVLDALALHEWPGNVRELENVIQRALATAQGPLLGAGDLHFASARARRPTPQADGDSIAIPMGTTLADAEELLITRTLNRCGGDRQKAARVLGISSRTLFRRAKREREQTGELDEATS
jgi:two-component system response regulator HydG